MSNARVKRITTAETKKKLSESKSGENHPMFGKTHTDETKKKQSDAKKGEKNHNFGKTGDLHPKSKKVYQYDLDGKYIRWFGSCSEAGRSLGKYHTNIARCARGERKDVYGFRWSYEFNE